MYNCLKHGFTMNVVIPYLCIVTLYSVKKKIKKIIISIEMEKLVDIYMHNRVDAKVMSQIQKKSHELA